MGVSGSGKTTIAEILRDRLGWPFQEGDALHPETNVRRMRAGDALSDEDRGPWLELVADWVEERLDAGEDGLITCSALKRAYRKVINRRGYGVTFVYLKGSYAEIRGRVAGREGHFMPAGLLRSQFADLEPPGPDEPAIEVDIGPPPGVVAQEIIDRLRLVGSDC